MSAFSAYMPEITNFARQTGGKAVYCFVVDGTHGTGGCPMVNGAGLPAPEYRRRCEALIGLMERSIDMLKADLARQKV